MICPAKNNPSLSLICKVDPSWPHSRESYSMAYPKAVILAFSRPGMVAKSFSWISRGRLVETPARYTVGVCHPKGSMKTCWRLPANRCFLISMEGQ